MRSSRRTRTVSPAALPMAFRTSALTGSLCVPSPSAMNALSNGSPSMVPRTLTRPRVPKNSAEPSICTYVCAPFASPLRSGAVNSVSMWVKTAGAGGTQRSSGGDLARRHRAQLLGEPADLGIVEELERPLARGEGLRRALGAGERVRVARPRGGRVRGDGDGLLA